MPRDKFNKRETETIRRFERKKMMRSRTGRSANWKEKEENKGG